MLPRLLTATVLVWLAMPAARAGADLLPSRPITFGDGRVVVSGDVAMSFGSADVGYFNLFDYSHDAFNAVSYTHLTLPTTWTPPASVVKVTSPRGVLLAVAVSLTVALAGAAWLADLPPS